MISVLFSNGQHIALFIDIFPKSKATFRACINKFHDNSQLVHESVARLIHFGTLRSISINSTFSLTPKGNNHLKKYIGEYKTLKTWLTY